MTGARRWLDSRTPAPPAELRAAVEAGLDVGADAGGAARSAPPSSPPVELLTGAAVARLTAALERPGRVRESAFDLLAADALATYACEAALDADDPGPALARLGRRLLESGGAS